MHSVPGGCTHSLVTGHTPPFGTCGLSFLQDEVQTLPGGCTQPPVTGHTPPFGACSLSSLRDEVQTLPGGFSQPPVGGHTPSSLSTLPGHWPFSRSLGTLPQLVPVVSAPSKMRCRHSRSMRTAPDGWWGREETGAVAAGEFPKVPPQVFFLWGKSCGSLLTRKACPLTQPTSPARPETVRVRVTHGPTFNSPQPAPVVSGLCWFITSSLFPSL